MRIVIIAVVAFIMLATCVSVGAADDETIMVHGIGYPPIKAESQAQAYLMARRAAVVSAYRNALSNNSGRSGAEEITEHEISGFISGMKIVSEEYLQDGGMRVTIVVPKKSMTLNMPDMRGRDRNPVKRHESRPGPSRVTREEWYSIIDRLVKIDQQQ